MDDLEPLLTREQREALEPQRPPERFAERVMARVNALPARRRRVRRVSLAAAGVVLAAAASFALVGRTPGRGEARADTRMDLRVGPHVVAVLERGAHIAWNGDDVTQDAGDVFYRIEPGGTRRVHTPAGDVTVRGTCFEVKVRGETPGAKRETTKEGGGMTGRDARAGAIGAIAGAAVLVGVYEGKVTLSRASASVDIASGQAARADAGGVHGPQELSDGEKAFEASSGEDPWRAANASLAEQVKQYQRRLDDNEAQRKKIEKELKELKAKLAPDGGEARNPMEVDPRDLTQDDWKQLAKAGLLRAGYPCAPPDWHPSPGELAELGLAPDDARTLQAAVQDAQQRSWQAIESACARMVGSHEVARRLGAEACGAGIVNATSKADFNKDIQLVADIRAGNTPMPTASQLDPLAAYWLALTGEQSTYEAGLARSFGPETAHHIARDDSQAYACELRWGRYASE
jgi:hypothetical protein